MPMTVTVSDDCRDARGLKKSAQRRKANDCDIFKIIDADISTHRVFVY